MSDREPKQDGTQAIRRAAAVLRCAATGGDRGVSLRQVSEATALSRSTAHRIVKCLMDEQLLHYDDEAKRYVVGDLVFELGLAAGGRSREILRWRPLVDRLARTCGATAYLIARSGHESVCLYKAEGGTVLRAIPVEVGQRRPLGVGAAATALLAAATDADMERVLAAIAPHLKEFPRLSLEQIRHNVAATRENGLTESRSFVAEGIYGLGMAIAPSSRPPTLAVSIAVHQSLATEENIAAWKRHFADFRRQAADIAD
jgi:DNA-binding IclR family transcriptional regulator